MTGQENEDSPYKSHLWKAIERFSARLDLAEEKIKMIDAVVERQSGFALGEISRYDSIRKEIAATNTAIAELTEKVNQLTESIAAIRKAPLVVVGFMASLAALGSTLVAIWKNLNQVDK